MLTAFNDRRMFLVLPFIVLLLTRTGIELSVRLLELRWAWLPAFGSYYLAIVGSLWFARRYLGFMRPPLGSWLPVPSGWRILIGVVVPALLPLGVFIPNVRLVPWPVLTGILAFVCINPFFEEAFWRGLLADAPLSPGKRLLFSAALFSFSHYFLWGAYWLVSPYILLPTCVTTFIMGLCWMWFYQQDRRPVYPIISHMLVDVFNLSIAIFMGIPLPHIQYN